MDPDATPEREDIAGNPSTDGEVVVDHARITGNAASYMSGQLLSWAAAAVSIAIIPRTLGETAVGEIAIAGAIVGTAASVVGLSIEQYVATEVGRLGSGARDIAGAALAMRLCLLPLLLAVAFVGLRSNHGGTQFMTIGWLIAGMAALGFIIGPMRSILTGLEQGRRVAALDLSVAAVPLFSIPVLHYGPVAFCAVNLLVTIPNCIGASLTAMRLYPARLNFSPSIWKNVAAGSFGYFINDAITPLNTLLPILIIRHIASEGEVGVYSQAQRLLGTFMFIPAAITSAILPTLARMAHADHPDQKRMQERLYASMVIFGLPIMCLAFTLATPLCQLLYGADKFRTLPQAVQAAGLCVVPIYLTTVLYKFLVAQRRNARWAIYAAVGVATNLLSCVVLVPWAAHSDRVRGGSAGAMAAFAVAELVITACVVRELEMNPWAPEVRRSLGKAALAAVVMLAVLWVTRPLFFVLRGALGIAVYGVIIARTEALGIEQQRRIGEMLRRKLKRG